MSAAGRRSQGCAFRPAALLLVLLLALLNTLSAPACKTETPTQPIVPPPEPPPPASEIYVDAAAGDDGGGDGSESKPYRTIGMGIQKSSPGMTVIVNPGRYDAALGESFPLRLKENVTLRGADAAQVTVDGGGTDSVLEDAPQARIERLTVRGGRPAGVVLRHASALVSCVLTGNFRGVVCESSAAIESNVVRENTDTGIYLQGESSAAVRDNTVAWNDGDGVECVDSSTPRLEGNVIRENRKHGLTCTDSSAPTLEENTVTQNVLPEVYVLYDARPTLTGNVIRGNERYGIDDARSANRGQITALNNTWDDPQPMGTIHGPADRRPVYWIKEAGNSIKFSD
ncbi:MAG: DUF1565 domain-containing protein [Candidatus Aminicenantes bacterium]|nr:DUF1565 domain-containing protein [Candidatus Aminicenantes bacterium]